MKSSAGSERRRTRGDARGWRGASDAGVAGVAGGATVLQQAEAGWELATLPASRSGGPGAEAPPGL